MLCSRVQNLLSAYCDRELTGVEMLEIRQHLDACEACRREHEQLVQVKRLFGSLGAAAPPRDFDSGLLDRAPSVRHSWLRTRLLAPVEALFFRSQAACDELRARLQDGPAVAAGIRRRMGSAVTAGALASCTFFVGALLRPQHPDAVSAHLARAMAIADDNGQSSMSNGEDVDLYGVASEPRTQLPLAYIPAGERTPVDGPILPAGEQTPAATAVATSPAVRVYYPEGSLVPAAVELPLAATAHAQGGGRAVLVNYHGSSVPSFSW